MRKHYLFISTNGTPWGGSEELWGATAAVLAEWGHDVTVYKPQIDDSQPRVKRLRELGVRMRDLARVPFHSFLIRAAYPFISVLRVLRLALGLTFSKPDLVVVSQGGNFDGILLANVVRRMKKPYVLISQKAADFYWQMDARLPRTRAVFGEARAAFFVSEHNLRLTQEMIGFDLPNGMVVRNPFLVPWTRREDWPSDKDGIRLACIGRLYPSEKGQDLLIRVLSRVKWRNRAVSVTFIGDGINREALERMAEYYGLTSVTFAGFVEDVPSIWSEHHALVLPSRCEGLPLVLVEAMLSGRVAIVTDVAGNGEVVRDDVTGFLAAAPTEDALDEALERAWHRRHEWRSIGVAAAEAIRTLIPHDPAATMATILERVAEGQGAEATERPVADEAGSAQSADVIGG